MSVLVVKTIIPSGKVRIKVPTLEAGTGARCEFRKKAALLHDGKGRCVSKEKPNMPASTSKRGPQGLIEGQKEKRQKMDLKGICISKERSSVPASKKKGFHELMEGQKQKRQKMDLKSLCISKEDSSQPASKPQRVIEGLKEKRQKMDRRGILQCASILRSLMSHSYGWVFNVPVDPVALDIPDYLSVIAQPMDLGTIKSKLEKHIYSDLEDFASDVRLTFFNAMTYNPPDNGVHIMAKGLSSIFERSWKDLEKNLKSEPSKEAQDNAVHIKGEQTNKARQNCHSKTPSQNDVLPKRLCPSQEKFTQSSSTSRDATVHIRLSETSPKSSGLNSLKGTDSSRSSNAHTVVSKSSGINSLRGTDGCRGSNVHTVVSKSSGINSLKGTDSSGSSNAYTVVSKSSGVNSVKSTDSRSSSYAQTVVSTKVLPSSNLVARKGGTCSGLIVKLSDPAQTSPTFLGKKTLKGSNRRISAKTVASAKGLPPFNPVSQKGGTCTVGLIFSNSSDSGHASSDLSSDGSHGRVLHECGPHTSKLDCQPKSVTQSYIQKSNPESDGAGSAPDDHTSCSPQHDTTATHATSQDMHLPPEKALRAAMLKCRFAETILRARLNANGYKINQAKIQEEKKILERKQLEEKARIEAEMKAARKKAEEESQKIIEQEREAARLALEKMVELAEPDINLESYNELEKLCGHAMYYGTRTLERLGLFKKDRYWADCYDDILARDMEEGEICS